MEKELVEFYKPFFFSEEETEGAISLLMHVSIDNQYIPRSMLNQVKRYVEIITKIDEAFPGRDGLRILFVRICLESLCYLSKEKKESFYSSITNSFSEESKTYILNHFVLESCIDCTNNKEIEKHTLTMDNYLRVLGFLRNRVAHDGVFWDFRMFSSDGTIYSTYFVSDKDVFNKADKNKKAVKYQYNFETSLCFDVFISFYVDACLRYICRFAGKPDLYV